jgi:hypothetical protein
MARLSLILPAYEYAVHKLQDEVTNGFHMLDEILSLFPPNEVVHRGAARLVSSPNILDRPMKPYESKVSAHPAMFLQTDVIKFRDILLSLTTSLLNQRRKETFETMFETSDAVENSIDGEGRNFWEVYIEALQKLDYRFQADKVYVNSATARKIEAVPPTEEQLQRMTNVVKAKQEERLAKKRFRRLS